MPSPSSAGDRKSTRLNSSHSQISYAVFCLKKKTKIRTKEAVQDGTRSYPRPHAHTRLDPVHCSLILFALSSLFSSFFFFFFFFFLKNRPPPNFPLFPPPPPFRS